MDEQTDAQKHRTLFPTKAVYALALFFVFLGIMNSMPTIPGWDEMWRNLFGNETLKVRNFATEWFYPIVFFIMMCVVAMRHSMWRDWRGTGVLALGFSWMQPLLWRPGLYR